MLVAQFSRESRLAYTLILSIAGSDSIPGTTSSASSSQKSHCNREALRKPFFENLKHGGVATTTSLGHGSFVAQAVGRERDHSRAQAWSKPSAKDASNSSCSWLVVIACGKAAVRNMLSCVRDFCRECLRKGSSFECKRSSKPISP